MPLGSQRGPQNPPKTVPKCLPNRTPKKDAIFWQFLSFFGCPISLKSSFSLGKINIFESFAKNVFLQRSIDFASKNLPKTLQKRRPKPSRIDIENRRFSTSIFSGFGLLFEASWASKSAALP